MKRTLLVFCFAFLLVINFALAQTECSDFIHRLGKVKLDLNQTKQSSATNEGWSTLGQHLLLQLKKSSCNNDQAKEVLVELDKEIRMVYNMKKEQFEFSEIQKHINTALRLVDKATKTLQENDTNLIIK